MSACAIYQDNNLVIWREHGVNGWSFEKNVRALQSIPSLHCSYTPTPALWRDRALTGAPFRAQVLLQPVVCTREQLARRLQTGLQVGAPPPLVGSSRIDRHSVGYEGSNYICNCIPCGPPLRESTLCGGIEKEQTLHPTVRGALVAPPAVLVVFQMLFQTVGSQLFQTVGSLDGRGAVATEQIVLNRPLAAGFGPTWRGAAVDGAAPLSQQTRRAQKGSRKCERAARPALPAGTHGPPAARGLLFVRTHRVCWTHLFHEALRFLVR